MARAKRAKSERHKESLRPEPEYRVCSWCRKPRPKEEFALCAKHGRQRYCRSCHAAAMRVSRARRPGQDTKRYRADPEYRKKVRARTRVRMRRLRGTLPKRPCERCGAPIAQTHHDDYDRPTTIRWLCVKCHGAEHYPGAQPEHRAAVANRFEELAKKYAGRRS